MTLKLVGGTTMTKKRGRKRPFDPAEAARIEYERRKDPARWGTNDEALTLESNADVKQEAETRKNERRVRRFDVFALLFNRDGLSREQFDAIRRYQTDMAMAARVGEFAGPGEFVDRSRLPSGATDRQIDARNRLDDAKALLGLLPGQLLEALSEPEVIRGEQVNWRKTVEARTGETEQHAQAACVRQACEGLKLAYQEIDKRPRRAA